MIKDRKSNLDKAIVTVMSIRVLCYTATKIVDNYLLEESFDGSVKNKDCYDKQHIKFKEYEEKKNYSYMDDESSLYEIMGGNGQDPVYLGDGIWLEP